jgi:hypothetical protein
MSGRLKDKVALFRAADKARSITLVTTRRRGRPQRKGAHE